VVGALLRTEDGSKLSRCQRGARDPSVVTEVKQDNKVPTSYEKLTIRRVTVIHVHPTGRRSGDDRARQEVGQLAAHAVLVQLTHSGRELPRLNAH
jgi:hypothetical protein